MWHPVCITTTSVSSAGVGLDGGGGGSTLGGMIARKLCANDLKCPLISQIVLNAYDILIYIIHIVFSMFIACDISI